MRPRHYISRTPYLMARPVFRYSHTRDALVLRIVGERVGPVLRLERRRRQRARYDGVERRYGHGAVAGL